MSGHNIHICNKITCNDHNSAPFPADNVHPRKADAKQTATRRTLTIIKPFPDKSPGTPQASAASSGATIPFWYFETSSLFMAVLQQLVGYKNLIVQRPQQYDANPQTHFHISVPHASAWGRRLRNTLRGDVTSVTGPLPHGRGSVMRGFHSNIAIFPFTISVTCCCIWS